jgi:hypothetical protein
MNKNIITEIKRINSLMLISEEINYKSIFDDLISVLDKNVASKLEREISPIIDKQLARTALTNDELSKLKSFFNTPEGEKYITSLNDVIKTSKSRLEQNAIKNYLLNVDKIKNLPEKGVVQKTINQPIEKGTTEKTVTNFTQEAEALFKEPIESAKFLTQPQIESINDVATKITQGTLSKLDTVEMHKITNEMKTIGIDLQKVIDDFKKTKEFKKALMKTAFNDKFNALESTVQKFNKMCNFVVDSLKGNKITYYLLKMMKKLIYVFLSIALSLYVLTWAIRQIWDWFISKVRKIPIIGGMLVNSIEDNKPSSTSSVEKRGQYDDKPSSFKLWLNANYGKSDWDNDFTITKDKNTNIITVTDKKDGDSRKFKYGNGNYEEIK